MKKVLPGAVLVLVGAFLLTLGLLATFWAPARAERTPLNVDSRTYLTGQADKLDPATGQVGHFNVKVTNITQIDPKKSDGSVAAFTSVTCVNKDINNPPDCLTKADPRMIVDSSSVFATDRHTGMALNNTKYVPNTGITYTGLVNKFPFGTKKQTYQFWDDVANKAVPAVYKGESKIDGLTVYRFDMAVTNQPIDLGNNIAGVYSLTKTMYIEPHTGAIISQAQHDVRKLAAGGTALDMTISYTPQTVAKNVSDGKANVKQLNLITSVIPLIGLILGPLLIIVGVGLILWGRRSAHRAAA